MKHVSGERCQNPLACLRCAVEAAEAGDPSILLEHGRLAIRMMQVSRVPADLDGDQVLQVVSKILQKKFHRYVVVVEQGDDDRWILCSSTCPAQAASLMNRATATLLVSIDEELHAKAEQPAAGAEVLH